MKRLQILLLSLPLLPGAISAQEAAAARTGLRETLDRAAAHSSALKKSVLDRQSLEHRIREEKSVIYPQINAGVSLDAYPVLPTQLIPGEFFNRPDTYVPVRFGQPWSLAGTVQVEQLLFSETYKSALPARDASRALLDLLTEKTGEEVAFNTAGVFYQTLQTAELLRSVNANLDKLAALQKMAQLQVENGYAVPLDVKRIAVARSNLETQRQNLAAAVAALQNTLKFLCGVPEQQPFVPGEMLENPAADSTRWLALQLEPGTLTEHRILQKTMELLRLRTRALRAERYPTVHAYSSGLLQTQRGNANFFDGSGRWFPMLVFGLKMRAPLFDGFRRSAKAAQLDYDWLKMDEDRKQLGPAKQLEFSQAKSQFESALRLLGSQRQNMALAADIRDKFFLQYKEGSAPLSDLLNTQTALSEAETNYWQQVFNYKLAALKLAKAAGRPGMVAE